MSVNRFALDGGRPELATQREPSATTSSRPPTVSGPVAVCRGRPADGLCSGPVPGDASSENAPSIRPAWCANVVAAARVRRGEFVVVAVDEPLLAEAELLLAAIADAGARTRIEVLPAEPEEELSSDLRESALATDARIALWQRPRRQTAAGRSLFELVRSRGGRFVTMPLMTRELLEREASRPPPKLAGSLRRLLAELDGIRDLRLQGRAGTDVRLAVEGVRWQADGLPLEPGGLINYPSGEVYALPRSADGVVVADLTVPLVADGPLRAPVTIRFDHGRVASIEGGDEAARLRELVDGAGEGAERVAEVGFGMNPTLEPRGHVLIDEKVAGTAHVAIGSNTHMGGTQAASIHVDCVFSGAEAWADGRRVELPNAA